MTQEPTDFLRVSYSSLNTFSSCARLFEFNKIYPRRARDYDTFAADVGKALHAAYQNFLVTRNQDSALWELLRTYPHADYWHQEKDDRSILACVMTLDEMIQSEDMSEWIVCQIKKPNGEVVPAIEVPFEFRLKGIQLPDGRGIAIVGFIDALLQHVHSNRLRTWDIKTTRSFLKNVDAKYKFDTQQIPYGIVLEHVLGHNITEFQVGYMDTFVDVAEPRVTPYVYDKSESDVQEWLMNTVLKCQSIQRYLEMDYFPRTDGGCMFYNKPCFFLDVCESRDRKSIEAWLLEGQAPEQQEPTEPWVLATIDVYGES